MQDVVFNVVGVVLHKEGEQLQDQAEHLHRTAVRFLRPTRYQVLCFIDPQIKHSLSKNYTLDESKIRVFFIPNFYILFSVLSCIVFEIRGLYSC